MGNCCTSKTLEFMDGNINLDIEYNNRATLFIQQKDYFNRVVSHDSVFFELTRPIKHKFASYACGGNFFHISSCVIPGLDPRSVLNKECQDNLFILQIEKAVLIALFDGHGREGLPVVNFCEDKIRKYFEENYKQFEEAPIQQIEQAIATCDAALKSPTSGIDCALSGTTCVLIYLNETGLFVGGVGDSRAVLASLPGTAEIPPPPPPKNHGIGSKYIRSIPPVRPLKAEALTIDQKPNHSAELERIQKSGGRVQRLTDERGNKIGPYRVWRKHGNLPGLAMSRSIGDRIGSEVGIISTPICHEVPLFRGVDQFIVVASDGVWDVMDNIEVVNFVARYRKQSLNQSDLNPEVVKVTSIKANNTTIAHLLAEESRYRWFGIIEDEDVMIDDISVVVIELGSLEFGAISDIKEVADRALANTESIAISEDDDLAQYARRRTDPKRGSIQMEPETVLGSKRTDPVRGSIAFGSEETTGNAKNSEDEDSSSKTESDN